MLRVTPAARALAGPSARLRVNFTVKHFAVEVFAHKKQFYFHPHVVYKDATGIGRVKISIDIMMHIHMESGGYGCLPVHIKRPCGCVSLPMNHDPDSPSQVLISESWNA